MNVVSAALRMFADAAEQEGERGARNAYQEWADRLDAGEPVEALPPAGRLTVAVIEEWSGS